MPEGNSAGQEAQAILGEQVQVVSAFQNISAIHLKDPEHPVDCDVLVCGDSEEAREQVLQLVRDAGMFGVHAGPLANAVIPEGLTSVLLSINKHFKVLNSGIRITGIPRE